MAYRRVLNLTLATLIRRRRDQHQHRLKPRAKLRRRLASVHRRGSALRIHIHRVAGRPHPHREKSGTRHAFAHRVVRQHYTRKKHRERQRRRAVHVDRHSVHYTKRRTMKHGFHHVKRSHVVHHASRKHVGYHGHRQRRRKRG